MRSGVVCLLLLGFGLSGPIDAGQITVPGDQPNIQAGINVALPGDTVMIKAGVYMEDLTIVSRPGITLRPKGKGKVIIDANGSGSPLAIAGSDEVTIKKLRFRNTTDAPGILVSSSDMVRIEACRVQDTLIGIDATDSPGLRVRNSTIVGSDQHGIRIFTGRALLDGNRIAASGNHAIWVLGHTVTIRDNRIEETGNSAIRIGNDVNNFTGSLVENNLIERSSVSAIHLESFVSSCTVLGNRMRKATLGNGIEIGSSAPGHQIVRNSIQGASSTGIVLGSADNHLDRNRVIKPRSRGIYVLGTGLRNLLTRNLVKKSGAPTEAPGGNGFHMSGIQNVLIGNRAIQSANVDLFDSTAPNANIYIDNQFKTFGP